MHEYALYDFSEHDDDTASVIEIGLLAYIDGEYNEEEPDLVYKLKWPKRSTGSRRKSAKSSKKSTEENYEVCYAKVLFTSGK